MSDVDVLMIGHFAKDRLVVDGVGETASGGAVHYGGIALQRLGAQVGVVTRLHADDFGRCTANVEYTGGKSSPCAAYAVYGYSADRIINFYFVKEKDGEDNDHTCNQTDND